MVAPAAAAALGTLALSGCATWFEPAQTAALRRAPPAGLPRRVEKTSTPFFAQTRYHCGPAALATALADVGLQADPEALGEAIFLPARQGTLQLEMLAGARRQGALATRLPADLAALTAELAAGNVVVVLQNLGLAMAPVWHYAVLVGYDLDAGSAVLRSGTTEREVMALGTFEHTWARAGRWAIAVLPPGRWPITATEAEALQAALGFERVAPAGDAATAYRALLARWPANLVAAIGLGNALQAAGDLAGAAAALEAAAARHDSVMAWHNLARVRLALGDRPAARTPATRALQRAERAQAAGLPEAAWLERVRATLAEIG